LATLITDVLEGNAAGHQSGPAVAHDTVWAHM